VYVATCTQAAADTEQLSFIACIQDDASRTIQVIRDAWSDGGQTPPAEIQTAIDTAAPVVAGVGGQLAIWDLRRSVTFRRVRNQHRTHLTHDRNPERAAARVG